MLSRIVETVFSVIAWVLNEFGFPEVQDYLESRPSQTVRFHDCGGQVEVNGNKSVASRLGRDNFRDGIAFSHRPIKPCETVSVRILKTTRKWVGPLALGFTCLDPQTLSLTDLLRIKGTSRHPIGGVWIKTLLTHRMKPGLRIDFHFDMEGRMSYSVDGEEQDDFMVGLPINRPLWAVFDVYGSVQSIKLIRGGLSTAEPATGTRNGNGPNSVGLLPGHDPLPLPTPIFPFSVPRERSGTTPPWTSLVFYSNFDSDSPIHPPHPLHVQPMPLFHRRRGNTVPNLNLNLDSAAPSGQLRSPLQSPVYNSGNCVICLQAETSMMVQECGHLCLCKDCAQDFEQKSPRNAFSWDGFSCLPCPVCRRPVSRIGVI